MIMMIYDDDDDDGDDVDITRTWEIIRGNMKTSFTESRLL
jgi:hypothetical protein